jgi:hypothetical protein
MEIDTTNRELPIARFQDADSDITWTLQPSDIMDSIDDSPGQSYIWFGVENYNRVLLNRSTVADLIAALSRWLATNDVR